MFTWMNIWILTECRCLHVLRFAWTLWIKNAIETDAWNQIFWFQRFLWIFHVYMNGWMWIDVNKALLLRFCILKSRIFYSNQRHTIDISNYYTFDMQTSISSAFFSAEKEEVENCYDQKVMKSRLYLLFNSHTNER